jgi:hypothetical protein
MSTVVKGRIDRPEKRWKPIRANRRYVALNMDGKRCAKKASWGGQYHGDHEIYHKLGDNDVTWVYIELCNLHASNYP